MMTPLYRDPHFTFRFLDDRVVARFHLDGVSAGASVSIAMIDAGAREAGPPIMTATVGNGGWVDLARPIKVAANGGFIVVPEPESP